jgi:WD40 repeat protein
MDDMPVLNEAIKAIKAGDKATGRALLSELARTQPQNETVWMWLAVAVEDSAQKREYLRRTLQLNPDNVTAKQALARLEARTTVDTPELADIVPEPALSPPQLKRLVTKTPSSSKKPLPSTAPKKRDIRIGIGVFISYILLLAIMLPGICVLSFGLQPCGWLDVALGRRSGCLYTLTGHTYVSNVVFTPDENILASLGAFDDHEVWLWRAADGALLRTLEHNFVRSAAFSPDSRILASGSGDIRLWNPGDGTLIRTLDKQKLAIMSLAFSPDGRTLASASDKVRLWHVANGTLIRNLDGYTARVSDASLAYSPDGTMLALGTYDKEILLWRLSDGQLWRTMKGHTKRVNSVAFSPDGMTLASAGGDQTVRLWRVADGSLLRTLEHKFVDKVIFSPDGTMLASAGNDGVKLWQVTDGSLRQSLAPGDTVAGITFSPDMTKLTVMSGNGRVRQVQLK